MHTDINLYLIEKLLYFNFFSKYFLVCSRPYHGGQTCITYDAVNAAYIDARKRIGKSA